jgi:glycosyltransferase involved in cell wall biosynthesis
MDKSGMKLSILIITYNQENYISECLESILIQKIPFEFEIVVSDDCSSDSTLYKAEKILRVTGYNYKILRSDHNAGISGNYQRGFNECTGEYIAVIEGDDYWTNPDRIVKHITFLETHRECVMSFNRIISFYESSSRFIIPEWSGNDDFEYITSGQLAEGNRIGNLSACVFRNSAIQKLKQDLYDLEIADWMLGITLGQFGLIAYLKEAMSVYRISVAGQWGKMSREEQIQRIIILIDIYNKYLGFKFDKEFSQYRDSLLSTNKDQVSKHNYLDFFPPIIISVFKWLIPVRLRQYIKQI